MFDYLVIGAGLFGSVFSRELTNAGAKCLVLDKRSHIGGNCYTKNHDGINVHKYGPHIFHTNNMNHDDNDDQSFGEYFDAQNKRLRKMLDNKDAQQHLQWLEEYEKRHNNDKKDST